MKAAARSRRDRIRAQLADLKMPGALEAIDDVLTGVDGGGVTASEAIEQLLGAHDHAAQQPPPSDSSPRSSASRSTRSTSSTSWSVRRT